MKILSTKYSRSIIAETLRKKGEFKKEGGKYIQGDLEIWFLDASAIREEHIEWADIICGRFYGYRVNKFIEESGKYTNEQLLKIVQYEIYGSEKLWQVVICHENTPSMIKLDIKQVKVFKHEVESFIRNKRCFREEIEAAKYASNRVKEEIKKCEDALKYLQNLDKEWQRTLNSF